MQTHEIVRDQIATRHSATYNHGSIRSADPHGRVQRGDTASWALWVFATVSAGCVAALVKWMGF